MKRIRLVALSLAITALAAAAYAQTGVRRGGGNYNPATETTMTGTIEDVKTMPMGGRGMGGVHFTLTVASGPIEVHVGPSWFVASKNVAFAKGDALTVVGSKVTIGGQEFLIAREIRKGDQVLVLRDAKGFPQWAGHGRGY